MNDGKTNDDDIHALYSGGFSDDSPAPTTTPRRNGNHVIIPSDYPGEPAIHVMRHHDGDYSIAVVNGDRWPMGKAATMSSSGGRSPGAWQATASLWRSVAAPMEGTPPECGHENEGRTCDKSLVHHDEHGAWVDYGGEERREEWHDDPATPKCPEPEGPALPPGYNVNSCADAWDWNFVVGDLDADGKAYDCYDLIFACEPYDSWQEAADACWEHYRAGSPLNKQGEGRWLTPMGGIPEPVRCSVCDEPFAAGDAVRVDTDGSLLHDVDCEHPRVGADGLAAIREQHEAMVRVARGSAATEPPAAPIDDKDEAWERQQAEAARDRPLHERAWEAIANACAPSPAPPEPGDEQRERLRQLLEGKAQVGTYPGGIGARKAATHCDGETLERRRVVAHLRAAYPDAAREIARGLHEHTPPVPLVDVKPSTFPQPPHVERPVFVPNVGDPVEWIVSGVVISLHQTASPHPYALVDVGPGVDKQGISFARLFPAANVLQGRLAEYPCYACTDPSAPRQGAYCPRCESLRRTTLECTVCGDYPAKAALVPADAKPGDQCPCCFVPDIDCDGTLIDAALDSEPPTSPTSRERFAAAVAKVETDERHPSPRSPEAQTPAAPLGIDLQLNEGIAPGDDVRCLRCGAVVDRESPPTMEEMLERMAGGHSARCPRANDRQLATARIAALMLDLEQDEKMAEESAEAVTSICAYPLPAGEDMGEPPPGWQWETVSELEEGLLRRTGYVVPREEARTLEGAWAIHGSLTAPMREQAERERKRSRRLAATVTRLRRETMEAQLAASAAQAERRETEEAVAASARAMGCDVPEGTSVTKVIAALEKHFSAAAKPHT